MPYRFPFEKLEVWQLSRLLVKEIYIVSKAFPKAEEYGLRSQLNRAIVSVASNLAEGTSRISYKDQAHFSQIAYSSLMEVNCQLILAVDLEYLDKVIYDQLREKTVELGNKINSLRKSQLRKV